MGRNWNWQIELDLSRTVGSPSHWDARCAAPAQMYRGRGRAAPVAARSQPGGLGAVQPCRALPWSATEESSDGRRELGIGEDRRQPMDTGHGHTGGASGRGAVSMRHRRLWGIMRWRSAAYRGGPRTYASPPPMESRARMRRRRPWRVAVGRRSPCFFFFFTGNHPSPWRVGGGCLYRVGHGLVRGIYMLTFIGPLI